MLDTVKITLTNNMFVVMDKSKFMRDVMNSARGYFALVQNPTKSELQAGYYKPRLTLAHRFNTTGRSEYTLSVEASIPKLLYGNNFDEVTDDDYSKTVQFLIDRLANMGIKVWDKYIEDWPVSLIHYSKNIPLTDGSTPHQIIRKIQQADIPKSLDTDEAQYRNGGYGYKWHTNSYEIAFYDKVHDLEQAKKFGDKRSEEKDNAIQLSLLDDLKRRRQFEVLRIEVRLNQRQKIKRVLSGLGINSDMSLKSLYRSSISQAVLLSYIDLIEKKRPSVLDYRLLDPATMLADLAITGLQKPTKAFQTLGFRTAMETLSMRELCAIFGNTAPRNLKRFVSQIKTVRLPNQQNPFSALRKHISNYIPLHMVDYDDYMINNDKDHLI